MDKKKEGLNDEELNTVTGGSVVETEEPYITQPNETVTWEFKTFTIGPDGKVIKSVIETTEPARAGKFKILKCDMKDGETG